MTLKTKKFVVLVIPALFVIILDQVSKYLVRINPGLHRVDWIEGWLSFNFTKNPGMAMGMDWLSTPAISIIAILATIGIIWYILATLPRSNLAYLVCMSFIIGGAIGNIIDRITMGIVGGYGGVLDGHVVDFIHFTLEIGDTPVFPYIFNVADVAISTSLIVLILFHKKIIPVDDSEQPESIQENLKPDTENTSDRPDLSGFEQATDSESLPESEK